MTESHDLGPIGDRVLFEDEQIRVWEMVLEPGERSPMHHHEHDYIVVVEGDHVTVEPLEAGSKSAPVTPGTASSCARAAPRRPPTRERCGTGTCRSSCSIPECLSQ